MQSEFAPILQKVDLLLAEMSALAMSGPRFRIVHRFAEPHTLCMAGEEIAGVLLLHRTKEIPVPLSLRLRMLFDYLARHRHLPQSASQIAAGIAADPFCREHGRNANPNAGLQKTISRSSAKQQIMRLRKALTAAFRDAGMNFDSARVLVSEKTTTNEVRYRLKASMSWHHVKSHGG